jgi:hypothetical protein
MSSDRKTNASRSNGAKSRGPVTPEGRRASSMNALCHGLSTKTLVISTESADEFQSLTDSFVQEYQPQGPTEAALVHRLAWSVWRAHRYDGIETGMFDIEIGRQAGDVDEEYVQIEPNPTNGHPLDEEIRPGADCPTSGRSSRRRWSSSRESSLHRRQD